MCAFLGTPVSHLDQSKLRLRGSEMPLQVSPSLDEAHLIDGVATMEALASVVALVGATLKTYKYVNSVTDASKERRDLSQEAADLIQRLTAFRNMLESPSSPSLDAITGLTTRNGPFDQLRDALEHLNSKLKPSKGVKKLARALVWPLDKEECKEVIDKIGRIKSLINLALAYKNKYAASAAIKADTAAGIDAIKQGVAGLQVREDVKDRQAILNWFSPLNFFKTQQDILARREEGTGQWIIESPEFQAWFHGPDRTLCCKGIPGAGKSVLASIAVDFLRKSTSSDRRSAVAAVFCNFKETNVQSLESLLASICVQALAKDVPIPEALRKLYESHRAHQTRPTFRDISHVFVEIAKPLDSLYLVIDALDECSADARDVLIRELRTLVPTSKLLVTTRSIEGITSEFTNGPFLEISARHDDLAKYIQTRYTTGTRLPALLQQQPSLKEEILKEVIAKANGMFLAVKLHMESLSSKTNIQALKKAMTRLPTTLRQLYDDTLKRINSQNEDEKEIANKALRWIVYAYEPLTVRQLKEALAIDPEADDFDPEAAPPITLVLHACGGLLVVDDETHVVRLVHYTAQEYFDALEDPRFADAHNEIAAESIAYLSYGTVQSLTKTEDYSEVVVAPEGVHLSNRFLLYASRFWAQHAKVGQAAGLKVTIDTYLLRNPRVWLPLPVEPWTIEWGIEWKQCSGCGIAAYFGLCDSLRRILAETDDINALTHEGLSALHLAAGNNMTDAIKVLLEYGANIDCKTRDEVTPFLFSIKAGSRAAADLLLAEGANALIADREGAVPFAAVNWDSPIPMLQKLLDRGADVNVPGSHGRTSLMLFVGRGDLLTVQWLLDKGASVNIKDENDETVLHYMLESQVLDKGPDMTDIAEVLFMHGAHVNVYSLDGYSPLYLACRIDSLNIASGLLDRGIDVNMQDTEGRTALHIAASRRESECLDILLAHGADMEKQDDDGQTPLMHAVSSNSTHAISSLLKAGADVHTHTKYGVTALHIAAARANLWAIEELLKKDASPTVRSSLTLEIYVAEVICVDIGGRLPFGQFLFGSRRWKGHKLPVLCDHRQLAVTKPFWLVWRTPPKDPLPACWVWESGMTALDVAYVRGNEDCIKALQNSTSASKTKAKKVSLEDWMREHAGANLEWVVRMREYWRLMQ
ncbi:MAG: hypothetical protein L6R40_006001 [Gallowayella cf. fulva]|nr:MAG: hypothetical protein L6R40_006001 [Xanthomendoza cf. fulva]